MPAKLTILLTLKGRHLHTLRWLWHANRIRLPFPIFIADGEVDPTIARILSDPRSFPALTFEYHRYHDANYTDFYRKVSDALGKIRTPYVMMSDNDDFLFPSGLHQCAVHLDENPDLVCAGGGIPGFSLEAQPGVLNHVVGRVRRVRYRCGARGRDLDQPSAAARALQELWHYHTIYYHVYRTEALRTIAREAMEHDFSDLVVHEYFLALRAATLGKVKSDNTILSYMRQGETSSGGYKVDGERVDWVVHLLESRFPQDFRALADSIASEAARIDETDAGPLRLQIREGYARILRTELAGTMLRHRFPRLFQLKQALLALRLGQRVPTKYLRQRDEARFWKQLDRDGAGSSIRAAHREEFDDIVTTLEGCEFVKYVEAHAPDLTLRKKS